MLALVLDRKPETRAAQMNALVSVGDPHLADQVARASTALQTAPVEARLPLVDLALPALRRLSRAQYTQLRAALELKAPVQMGLRALKVPA